MVMNTTVAFVKNHLKTQIQDIVRSLARKLVILGSYMDFETSEQNLHNTKVKSGIPIASKTHSYLQGGSPDPVVSGSLKAL